MSDAGSNGVPGGEVRRERGRKRVQAVAVERDEDKLMERNQEPDVAPLVATAKPRRSRPVAALADEVIALAATPLWTWGFPTLDREAPAPIGSLIYVLGPTGRGKSSFLAQTVCQHRGPSLIMSAELCGAIFAARMVSQTGCGSWLDVVRGKVDPAAIRRALAPFPKMRILHPVGEDWRSVLRDEIAAMRAEHPDEIALVAVDYLQILHADGRDPRERVTSSSKFLRELGTATGAVILAVARMARQQARAARDGGNLGTDGTEGGAEAAIEYDAVVQITTGAMKPEREDDPAGPQIVDVSINKTRFGAANLVVPFRFDGAHGTFADLNQAIPAAERKKESAADRMVDRVVGELADRTEPVNRGADDFRKAVGASKKPMLDAIRIAIGRGLVVAVERGESDDKNAQPILLASTARAHGYKQPPIGAPTAAPWGRP